LGALYRLFRFKLIFQQMKTTFILIVTVFTINATGVYAQDSAKTLAYNAYDKNNWSSSEAYFHQYLKTNSTDTFAVYYLAMAQFKQAKYKEALNHFRDLYEMDLSTGFKNELRFEQAKIYAALNDTAKCLQLLEAASTNGASFESKLKDTPFSTLRHTLHFAAIAEKFKKNATPCLYDDRYKKLDFFIGIWDVYIGDNYADKVAVDTVTKFYGGCSIDEKFKWLGSDYVGESISFYDNTAQRFRMCWAGKSGDIRNFEEIYSSKDSIQFLAITVSDSKKELMHRKMTISYNPANETLHEHIENSYDLGKTWEPDFDALFKKANR
jgi:tetratricopeptide (TPR) repeat protein